MKPVNAFQANLYTNRDEDGLYHPLFAREIAAAAKIMGPPKAAPQSDQPLIREPEDIRGMLSALKTTLTTNRRFGRVRPRYHLQGRIYALDEAGRLVDTPDTTWVTEGEGVQYQPQCRPDPRGPWVPRGAATAICAAAMSSRAGLPRSCNLWKRTPL